MHGLSKARLKKKWNMGSNHQMTAEYAVPISPKPCQSDDHYGYAHSSPTSMFPHWGSRGNVYSTSFTKQQEKGAKPLNNGDDFLIS